MAARGVEPRTPRSSVECSLRSELDSHSGTDESRTRDLLRDREAATPPGPRYQSVSGQGVSMARGAVCVSRRRGRPTPTRTESCGFGIRRVEPFTLWAHWGRRTRCFLSDLTRPTAGTGGRNRTFTTWVKARRPTFDRHPHGSGTRIRTLVGGARTRCPAARRSPNGDWGGIRTPVLLVNSELRLPLRYPVVWTTPPMARRRRPQDARLSQTTARQHDEELPRLVGRPRLELGTLALREPCTPIVLATQYVWPGRRDSNPRSTD